MTEPYDILILGAGPAGYVAAIRAGQLGFRVAVIDREHLGGVCLNWGCIPTKALLRSAEVLDLVRNAKEYGVVVEGFSPDLTAIVGRSRAVAERLSSGVAYLLRKNKVDVIWGEGHLGQPDAHGHHVDVRHYGSYAAPQGALGEGHYVARHVIIATGAAPIALPGLPLDGKGIVTYREGMIPQAIPEQIVVVGSGAIGVEYASFYCSFGSKVTLIERDDRILPGEDPEIARIARAIFEHRGIKVLTGVLKLNAQSIGARYRLSIGEGSDETELEVDSIVCAAGVRPQSRGFGLERLGVVESDGTLKTDGYGRTRVERLYAVGDVAGGPMLAHKAEHEAVHCVEAIAGIVSDPFDKSSIPSCIYSMPQIARVGLHEDEAKAYVESVGSSLRVGRFPYRANGKAIAMGETEGLIKTLFDAKSGKLLGAHCVGSEVTELIQGFVIAMRLETTEEELMHTIFPHPTLSEMMHESVLDAYGRALHI